MTNSEPRRFLADGRAGALGSGVLRKSRFTLYFSSVMATSQGDFTVAFPRLLVEPQSFKARMAQSAMRAPFAKCHLGNESRLDPVDLSTLGKHPFLERRIFLLKVRELSAQVI